MVPQRWNRIFFNTLSHILLVRVLLADWDWNTSFFTPKMSVSSAFIRVGKIYSNKKLIEKQRPTNVSRWNNVPIIERISHNKMFLIRRQYRPNHLRFRNHSPCILKGIIIYLRFLVENDNSTMRENEEKTSKIQTLDRCLRGYGEMEVRRVSATRGAHRTFLSQLH